MYIPPLVRKNSGLGSSSAAIVGGLIAGLVLAGHQLPCWGSEELLQLAASIEGAFRPSILLKHQVCHLPPNI